MKIYVKTSRKTEREKPGKALTKQDVIATIQMQLKVNKCVAIKNFLQKIKKKQ